MTGFPFWSEFKAIIVNGRYSSTSTLFIQDLNSNYISAVIPSRALFPDGSSTLVESLEFIYDELKGIRNSNIIFGETNDFSGLTVTAVLAYFDSLGDYGTTHWLRKYTDLLAIDKRDITKVTPGQGGANANGYKDILLNDRKVIRREFVPQGYTLGNGQVVDCTNIYVDMGNEWDSKIFTLLGDQTNPSGTEYSALYS